MHPFASTKNPVFFIAEIGGNHEGDFEYARRLTHLAIESGADAVKYQIYYGDALVSCVESQERNRHFKRFELSRDQYEALAGICMASGVSFMASVWDTDSLAWADKLIGIHKVGSGDMTAYPILEWLVGTSKPIILSTGLCTLEEVRSAVKYIDSLNHSYLDQGKLALLQCTTSYPCPDEDANLKAMLLLREEFRLPVGYSDHTVGSDAVLAAATMGAEIIEMHFTDTREGKIFRDHSVSITRDEIQELLARICRVKTLQGSGVKAPTVSELSAGNVTSFRRSIYAARPIKAGEKLTRDNLMVLRPAHGIPARRFTEVLGRHAARDLAKHEVVRDNDLA